MSVFIKVKKNTIKSSSYGKFFGHVTDATGKLSYLSHMTTATGYVVAPFNNNSSILWKNTHLMISHSNPLPTPLRGGVPGKGGGVKI